MHHKQRNDIPKFRVSLFYKDNPLKIRNFSNETQAKKYFEKSIESKYAILITLDEYNGIGYREIDRWNLLDPPNNGTI